MYMYTYIHINEKKHIGNPKTYIPTKLIVKMSIKHCMISHLFMQLHIHIHIFLLPEMGQPPHFRGSFRELIFQELRGS